MTDDFFAVVARQRACRSFSSEAVDDDAIARVLDAATFAPSAENSQPWEFVVVRDEATRVADRRPLAARVGRRTVARSPKAASRPTLLAEVERGATGGVADAPVNIVVCADVAARPRGDDPVVDLPGGAEPAARGDRARARQRAHDDHRGFRAEMQAILGLPEHVVADRARARSAIRPDPSGRRDGRRSRDHTHRERYGNAW